jgi:radical SAM superfamily enzyme YgiQ (UPF0313 family)
MKVLFLEIDTEREWAVASIGPAFLAAFIRKLGHEASLLRVPMDGTVDQLAAGIVDRSPDLIGVSLTTRQWQRARVLLAGVREHLSVPVVVGGLHPTFSPEETLRWPGIDYVCLGEGEKAFLYLVEALSAGVTITDDLIRNIWVEGGRRPELHKPFDPIDELPFMARDMLDEKHGVVHMTTQRGCPFPCTYCAARMYDELYAGTAPYGRRRSQDSVLRELFAIRDNGDLNYVIFLDDTFTIHHPWVDEFCEVYGEQLRIPFSIHARAETVNERMIHGLAAAGCRHITYGVESGSERLRRRIMKRPVTNEKMVKVFEWTKDAGILVTANYMMGVPGETRDEMQMTLDLHQELQPCDFGYFVFYPYPGTPLFNVCREKGYLPDDYLDRPANHRESILELPEVTKDDIAEFYDRWTMERKADMVRRYGPACTDEMKQASDREVERCAALG